MFSNIINIACYKYTGQYLPYPAYELIFGYKININQYGGLSWNIDLDNINYEKLTNFITDITQTKHKFITKENKFIKNNFYCRFVPKDIDNLQLLLTNDGKKYFDLIKNAKNNLTIDDISSYERLIIYLICKIFSLKCDTIKKTVEVFIPCTKFSSYGDCCGCDYAPDWFHKYHYDNNYEDTISYSLVYRKRKTGVLIYI